MYQTTVFSHYPRIGDRFDEQKLRRAIGRLDRGEITREALSAVADQVTLEVLTEQNEIGVNIITDGMLRWDDQITYLAGRPGNVEIGGMMRYFDTNTFYRQPTVTGPLEWKGPYLLKDYAFAKENSKNPVKVVLTGPFTLAWHCIDQHYGSFESLALAWAEFLNNELKALVQGGVERIQINEPSLVLHSDQIGIFAKCWDRLVQGAIDTPKVNIGLYFTFGSVGPLLPKIYDLSWHELGLDLIQGAASLPALKANPCPRKVALGLIDARNTKMEVPDEILAILRDLKPGTPASRTLLCPSNGLEFLPRYRAYDKLKLLTQIAALAKETLA